MVTILLYNKIFNCLQSTSVINRDSVDLIKSLMNNGSIENILKVVVEPVSRL